MSKGRLDFFTSRTAKDTATSRSSLSRLLQTNCLRKSYLILGFRQMMYENERSNSEASASMALLRNQRFIKKHGTRLSSSEGHRIDWLITPCMELPPAVGCR